MPCDPQKSKQHRIASLFLLVPLSCFGGFLGTIPSFGPPGGHPGPGLGGHHVPVDQAEEVLRKWPWVKTVVGSHFGVGEFTTHFRTYLSCWIGMFIQNTIWVLTHGQMAGNGGGYVHPLDTDVHASHVINLSTSRALAQKVAPC